MGGVPAAEAVSRFPGPPLEDPPTSPPHPWMGAPWGERGGTTGARAASTAGGAATRSRPPGHEQRRPRGRRDTKRAEGARLARRSSRCEHFSAPRTSAARLRAWRVTGVTIWPAPHRAKRSAATCKPASSSSGLRSRAAGRRESPRSAGTGMGRGRVSAGKAGLAALQKEWPSEGARRWPKVSGSTRSATARSGEAGFARGLNSEP